MELEVPEEPRKGPAVETLPPAPTTPGDITSTTSPRQRKNNSVPALDVSEELVALNNAYFGAVGVVQEYVDRMNSFGLILDPPMHFK